LLRQAHCSGQRLWVVDVDGELGQQGAREELDPLPFLQAPDAGSIAWK
jgi:hypothetical protein